MKKLILSSILGSIILLAGCSATTSPTNTTTTPAAVTFIENNGTLIQAAASIATGAVLNFAETDATKRTTLANEIYSSANAVNSLATGEVPTQAQVEAALVSFGGSAADANYATYAQSLAGLYGTYISGVNGDSKAALALLADLAAGAQQAASQYETVTTTVAN